MKLPKTDSTAHLVMRELRENITDPVCHRALEHLQSQIRTAKGSL